jgi:hypothetical protein
MPSGIGAYDAAGPVSGNAADHDGLDVTPGVWPGPPIAPGTVSERSDQDSRTCNELSHRFASL